jgi:hypothetical protein
VTKVSDTYNPLKETNQNNPEFYQNLYKAFKMTKLIQNDKAGAAGKHIDSSGQALFNYQSEEYAAFTKQIKVFAQRHQVCGEMCKHLLRFYDKLGFFPANKYDGRRS